MVVNERILKLQMKNPTDFGGPIDWKFELSAFRVLPYPSYYTKPFHSIPGGWLSKFAAENNRIAMLRGTQLPPVDQMELFREAIISIENEIRLNENFDSYITFMIHF